MVILFGSNMGKSISMLFFLIKSQFIYLFIFRISKYPWWPAIVVPPYRIPNDVSQQKKKPICVLFFGTFNYGWVSIEQICLYSTKDKKTKNANLCEAIEQADKALAKRLNKAVLIPPPYKYITKNKGRAKCSKNEIDVETICSCSPTQPCDMNSGCHNVHVNIECDPITCPAKEKCQNQNFRRGLTFSMEIQLTEGKGFGLFAMESIPKNTFIVEYVGEIINATVFKHRFNALTQVPGSDFYFFDLGKKSYIDASLYGNEARFINHSCAPNAKPERWLVQNQQCIGIFAIRNILPVCS